MKHVFLYMSPSGTTAQVVQTMVARLKEKGAESEILVVGGTASIQDASHRLSEMSSPYCLWVGSPVYVDHALPNLLSVLQAVRVSSTAYAVGFVTYGGVTTGVALYELLELLSEKKFVTLAGMKILCRHSSFRTTHAPLAAGHPDAGDRKLIVQCVDAVLTKLTTHPKPLEKRAYDYQTEKMKAVARQIDLAKIKRMGELPAVRSDLCIRCGECEIGCPVEAITLSPEPKRNADCIRCLACVHECPRQAFPFNFEAHEAMIRGMAEKSDEPVRSAFFVG